MIQPFDWEEPDYYKKSQRNERSDPFSTCLPVKESPTAKTIAPIDKILFESKDIYVDFLTDKPIWEVKECEFDLQKHQNMNFVMIGVRVKSGDSYVFTNKRWQICQPEFSSGWIDELSEILSCAKQIWMFDPDLFYGVMRFYQLQEQDMMRWRIKTKGLSNTLKKKYRCWKQLSTLCQMNHLSCPHAYAILECEQYGNFETAARLMKIRLTCLQMLCVLSTVKGIIIPKNKSKKRKRRIVANEENEENEQDEDENQNEQRVIINYSFN